MTNPNPPNPLDSLANSYRAAYKRLRTARRNYDHLNNLLEDICAQSYPDPVLWSDEINDLQYELCNAFNRACRAAEDMLGKAVLEVFAAHGLEDGMTVTPAADGTPKYDLTCPKTVAERQVAADNFMIKIQMSVKREEK